MPMLAACRATVSTTRTKHNDFGRLSSVVAKHMSGWQRATLLANEEAVTYDCGGLTRPAAPASDRLLQDPG